MTAVQLPDSELRYVSDTEPGFRRVRAGRGFRYVAGDSRGPSRRDKERIAALAVPPAWTDVWICRRADGHIQATGRDNAGRKQYVYHPEWVRLQSEAKFDGLEAFGGRLPALRRAVADDLSGRGLTKRRVTALTVRLLDATLIRVGNDRYVDTNGSYGLTTLERRHVEVVGSRLTFSFVAKGGEDHDVTILDRRLADLVRQCRDSGGQRLFTYETDEGTSGAIDSADVNDYLGEVTGEPFTAKDFRTWGASSTVTASLGDRVRGDEDAATVWLGAVDDAAELLGNTRAVCRASYVHPVLEDAFHDGLLADAWARSRRSRWMARGERALLRILRS